MPSKKNMLCARECAVLFQNAARAAVLDEVSNKPTGSTGLAHFLDLLDAFEADGGAVLVPVLMGLSPKRFDIPDSFPCAQRYEATISGDSLIGRLEALRDRLSSSDTPRPLYLNWVVRYVLRAGYALTHEREFRDVLIFAGLPSDPDMLETLYPNGTNLPEGLEIVQ